jgi:hypothetical protein
MRLPWPQMPKIGHGEAVTRHTANCRAKGPAGDQPRGWPEAMRVFARRERPRPGARLSLLEAAGGRRCSPHVASLPAATMGWRGQRAHISHRVLRG